MSAAKRVEFVSDRMSCAVLRGRWCDIVILNVHSPTENKIGNTDRFCKELELLFKHFLKLNMQILLEGFAAKLDREDILKSTFWN
jgi:hypothetical protein